MKEKKRGEKEKEKGWLLVRQSIAVSVHVGKRGGGC